MDAGKLDQRVTLQQRSGVADGLGQVTLTWVDVATVWARVVPLRGREFFAAAQIQQENTVRVILRKRSDVTSAWRLVWRGVAHDVTGVIALADDPGFMEIMALAGVKDGR